MFPQQGPKDEASDDRGCGRVYHTKFLKFTDWSPLFPLQLWCTLWSVPSLGLVGCVSKYTKSEFFTHSCSLSYSCSRYNPCNPSHLCNPHNSYNPSYPCYHCNFCNLSHSSNYCNPCNLSHPCNSVNLCNCGLFFFSF